MDTNKLFLTDAIIEKAKTERKSREPAHHEHNDCIRIAYEWLDAQQKIKVPNKRLGIPIKHMIESWGKRYVSQSDVEVAALLHLDILGAYPYFNISSRLAYPNVNRLTNISEAGKHQSYDRYDDSKSYKGVEN